MSSNLKNVLYIDDDEDLLDAVKISLEEIGGYSVMTCSNSDDGVRAAHEWRPDLIMLDVMMPGIDGPTTLKRIRENRVLDKIPVVFMTARTTSAQIEGYRQLGAVGTINKPFDPIGLSGQVETLWGQLHT